MYLEIQCIFQKIGNRESVKIIAMAKMLTTYENFKDMCKHICVYMHIYINIKLHLYLPIFVCSTNTSSVSMLY